MNFITPKQLKENKDKDPSLLILDIRDELTYKRNTVQNSINIDVYSDIKQGNIDVVKKKLSALPKNKTIVTVCNVGATAQKASLILEELGYATLVLEQGMLGWNALKMD